MDEWRFIMNQNDSLNEMMKLLSQMDPKQLETGLSKVSKMLNSPDADKIIQQIKKRKDLS